MQHMSLPDDSFEELLQDYASDTTDDGFSDLLMSKIDMQTRRQKQAKKICLYAAMFVGGLIAGKQVLALFEIWQSSAPISSLSSLPLIPIMAAIILPFMVWLFEQQEFSL